MSFLEVTFAAVIVLAILALASKTMESFRGMIHRSKYDKARFPCANKDRSLVH